MPKKKKPAGDPNEAKWVRVPTEAKGTLLCDVAYEQRCHVGVTLEVLGVVFEPGQIVTYESRSDVPIEFIEHPELQVRDVHFGVCRIDQMFRYSPLTLREFAAMSALVSLGTPELVVEEPVTNPDELPEGGE